MLRRTIHVVAFSGGKDSLATLLLAQKQFPGQVMAVQCDTGNEHEITLAHTDYVSRTLGIHIERLKADFTPKFESKRNYIRDKWPAKGVPAATIERALSLLHPSGNPFLDLCMLRGFFPSRMRQFCTEELKTNLLVDYEMWLIDNLDVDVWSWQGVRRDESATRQDKVGFEVVGGGLYINRPVAGWTAQQVVDFVRSCGLELNPLYSQGMSRVGCMPCINASKEELSEIARRFPEHIERIAEWERIVASVSRGGAASFFYAAEDGRAELRGRNITQYVKWAQTKRGGKVADPKWEQPAPACSSSYGLCE